MSVDHDGLYRYIGELYVHSREQAQHAAQLSARVRRLEAEVASLTPGEDEDQEVPAE